MLTLVYVALEVDSVVKKMHIHFKSLSCIFFVFLSFFAIFGCITSVKFQVRIKHKSYPLIPLYTFVA